MPLGHLIDLDDLPFAQWKDILELSAEISRSPYDFTSVLRNKIVAVLFYEPSTRTQTSFKTAAYRLGCEVVGFSNPSSSSVAKGECLMDTIKMMNYYSDFTVIRHPVEGAAMAASLYSQNPVINAGDGSHLHPTQTLTDIVTIYNECGQLTNLTIGICGDLKFGRTTHSLIRAMSRYNKNRFVFISAPELALPAYIIDELNANNISYTYADSLQEAVGELDVLYMTRIQQERFENRADYDKLRGRFVLTPEIMKLACSWMKVLHPLPRVDEIDYAVDLDEHRAVYFKQAGYGVYARMALLCTLDRSRAQLAAPTTSASEFSCSNNRCITHTEPYLPPLIEMKNEVAFCRYCDHRIV